MQFYLLHMLSSILCDKSVHNFFGKCYDVLCSKIPELLGHTFLILYRINYQGTYCSICSICKKFFRYTNSKKDMDIDMIWYNIVMTFWDRGYDIISQQLARYEIWYYILEFLDISYHCTRLEPVCPVIFFGHVFRFWTDR